MPFSQGIFSARTGACLVTIASLCVGACGGGGGGDEANQLPTQASADDSDSGQATSLLTAGGSGDAPSSTTAVADSTGPGESFPVAYRFDCVDIQVVGDVDGTALTAQALENTWTADIMNHKLNMIFEIVARGDSSAMAAIRSGVGTSDSDLCAEASSESPVVDVGYDPAASLYVASSTQGECSTAAAEEPSGGSYSVMLGAADTVYIYAQDTDGTVFNCTADDATPDAVPVHALQAEVTVSPDGTALAGYLTGCLLRAEAELLCSCLGQCAGTPTPACAGCPDGSRPLPVLLGGVNPSPNCTGILGADAFDLGMGFTASALPNALMTCG